MTGPIPNKPVGTSVLAYFQQWVWEKLVNQLRPINSDTVTWDVTTRGWCAHAAPGRGGGAPAAQPVQLFSIAEEFDDYLVAGTGQLIAKPFHLRRSAYQPLTFVAGVATWGTPYPAPTNGFPNPLTPPTGAYPQGPFTWVTVGQRTSSNGFGEFINRRYNVGDPINAFSPIGGTGAFGPAVTPTQANPTGKGAAITLLDANVDARQWFVQITDCIGGATQTILISATAPYPPFLAGPPL